MPASRPDRFDRARESGADLVIVDLEDAVPARSEGLGPAGRASPGASDSARPWSASTAPTPDWHADELDALAGSDVAIMVPKAESATDVRAFTAAMPGSPVIALVETPAGSSRRRDRRACPGVVRLALGNVDLAAALGVDPSSRRRCGGPAPSSSSASAAHDKAGPIDGVTTVLDDRNG